MSDDASRTISRVRFARRIAGVLVLMGSILLGSIAGQGLQGEVQYNGQWGGPYNLEGWINPDFAASGLATDFNWAEFAHIAVLPPPNEGLVLLWSRRHDLGDDPTNFPVGDVIQNSYIWDKNHPNQLTVIPVDNVITDASDEIFCSGHTFTEDGELFVAGGTDAPEFFNQRGTTSVHVFDNVKLEPPGGTMPSWSKPTDSDMDIRRYYPTATRLDNGDILVGGHSEPGHASTAKTRERAVIDLSLQSPQLPVEWDTGANPSAPTNYLTTSGCSVPTPFEEYSLDDYPHWHLLSAQLTTPGLLMRTDELQSFLRFETCAETLIGDDDRFEVESFPPQVPSPSADGINSVHLLYHDGLNTMNEVVYALGGGAFQQCLPGITNSVVKMVNPDPVAVWVGGSFDMNLSRLRSNTVILLDGSLLVIGGYGQDAQTGNCVLNYRRSPELYETPEIFGTPSATWTTMASQAHDRRYHSVAGLLPDGSVVSAGGVDTDIQDTANYPLGPGERQASMWSIERFKPPYFFSRYSRPMILDHPSTPIVHGNSFNITVNMFNTTGSEDFWVALVAPGTATHGVDMNQRYIKVKSVPFSWPATGPVIITVTAPNKYQAPPGDYMLTVVNEHKLPSEAQWMRIVLQ